MHRTKKETKIGKKKVVDPEKEAESSGNVPIPWTAVTNAIGNPIMILDRNHRILFSNQAMTNLAGGKKEDIIGKKCYEIIHKSQNPEKGCPMDASLAAGRKGSVADEVEVVVGFQTCLVSCTPVKDENGALTFYVHLATDITRQKRAEKRQRTWPRSIASYPNNFPARSGRQTAISGIPVPQEPGLQW